MNISPFIQTAFGAIVGGLVVITTNWLNTAREKRKEIQVWYEQRYVTEGIDPLLVYLTNMVFQLSPMSADKKLLLPDAIIPVEALTRIEVLLGVSGGMEFLGVYISQLNLNIVSEREYQDISVVPLFHLCEKLYQLRQEVLRLIPNKVRSKNQELNLSKARNDIMSLILDFTNETDALRQRHKEEKAV